ncbi:hypothetical protein Pmani_011276 [Petrolisthes manimaculis]|uniref:Heparan sulfate 2-O-sulfotransferase 1 n=1 Tax=Petrolisthes manimaculis TaxID=1843537 RepID=A0AAE1Q1E3_9EUCA|nr:hypothetical protein Pmani_011276 [Petrolisthes manimaculis]
MSNSRLMNSRVVVMLLVGVSAVVMLLYLHLATEVAHLHTSMHSHNAIDYHLDSVPAARGVLDVNNIVVIYNRVPKTGSTSFIGLAYDLCAKNKFNVIHINTTKNMPTLSLTDQMRFVYNVSNWVEKKPGIYHGHVAYLDFSRFGVIQQPIYINLIRKPLDRLISYYYFVRYGDDLRPNHIRRRMGDKMTLDECVAMDHQDCSPTHLWVQVPFFCGHHAECWVPGSSWALEQAKHNLVHKYLLVGVTEEMGDFVAMLEYSLPRLFKGAYDLYLSGKKSHIRKTVKKVMPSDETIAKLQNTKVWRLENDFYNFALDHFHFLRKKTLEEVVSLGRLMDRGQKFAYEKIKPKKT